MARTVTTAPDAAEALRQARLWLTQPGSGANGRARWEALRAARLRLREYPYLGAPSVEHPGCRQLVVSAHRIIDRIHPDTGDSATAGNVLILAVLGPGLPRQFRHRGRPQNSPARDGHVVQTAIGRGPLTHPNL